MMVEGNGEQNQERKKGTSYSAINIRGMKNGKKWKERTTRVKSERSVSVYSSTLWLKICIIK